MALFAGLGPAAGLTASSHGAAEEPVTHRGPRLILLLVVDQLGADEFERLDPFFTGGMRYLLDKGVAFTQAHHAHATTETAPGHATLATGRFPRHHGIVSNWWLESGDPRKGWAIDDDEFDGSPRRLLASTLGDWLKSQNPRSKVFAASGKDRAAILMGGLRADAAFWFDDETGSFVCSDYYAEPGWLPGFSERKLVDTYLGQAWDPLPLADSDIESLSLLDLDLGPLRSRFPHAPGRAQLAPDEDFYDSLRDYPWLDGYLALFARTLIEAEGLGRDDDPDLLALSFSAPDYVGHDFGPNSREYVDVLLRLDRTLGELLRFVDSYVGLDRTVIGFSADHGVVPVPEVRRHWQMSGKRVDSEVLLCLQRAGRELAREHGVEDWLIPGPVLAPGLSAETGLSVELLEQVTARRLEDCPSVAEVWTRSELIQEVDDTERTRWLFANSFHPDRSPDFLIQFEEFFMPSVSLLTTHGSSYPYDTRVPLVFLAAGLRGMRLDQPVLTADLAPTLAMLAGIDHPAPIDGRELLTIVAGVVETVAEDQASARLRQ